MSVKGQTVYLTLAAAAAAVGFIVADHLQTPFDHLFEKTAKAYDIDPNLLRAIARKESGFNPAAVGAKNSNGSQDFGLMQVNDRTAQTFGIPKDKLLDPAVCVDAAARLLVSLKRELKDKYSLLTWIAAYNAGAPAIRSRGIFNTAYVSEVKLHYDLYSFGRILAPPNKALA